MNRRRVRERKAFIFEPKSDSIIENFEWLMGKCYRPSWKSDIAKEQQETLLIFFSSGCGLVVELLLRSGDVEKTIKQITADTMKIAAQLGALTLEN